MTYDIEFIKNNWLVEGSVPYSENQVVMAFNEVFQTLGQAGLDRIKFSNGSEQTGPYVTTLAIELGLKLGVLKGGTNHNSLIAKLQSIHEIERIKGMAELRAIYFLCKDSDVDFELEPTVNRDGKTPSKPDFRVKHKTENIWTYVEVKQPDTSDENKIVRTVIERILKIFNTNTNILSIEVMLLRIPTEEELVLLEQRCTSEYDPNQSKEFEIETLGLVKMNNTTSIIYTPTQYEGFSDKPSLASTQNQIEGTPTGEMILKKSVTCRIAVSDQRAVRFLIDASDQLPTSSPNIIWIDGGHVPSIKKWPSYILKQFTDKPELNKKISGLITFTSGIGLAGEMIAVQNSATLTENQSADVTTPNWIREKITAANTVHVP